MTNAKTSTRKFCTVTDSTIGGMSSTEIAILWIYLVFPGDHVVVFLRDMMKSFVRHRIKVSTSITMEAIRRLENRKILYCKRRMATDDHCEYAMTAAFDTSGLLALARHVAERDWTLSWEDAEEVFRHAGNTILYENSGIYEHPNIGWNRYRVLVNLFTGRTVDPPDENNDDFFIGSDTTFEAGLYLAGRLAMDAVLRPSDYPGNHDVNYLPAIASALYMSDRNVEGVLEEIRRQCSAAGGPKMPAMCVWAYAALCAWRGDPQRLAGCSAWSEEKDEFSVSTCKAVASAAIRGEWAIVEKGLSFLTSPRPKSPDPNQILMPLYTLAYAVFARSGNGVHRIAKIRNQMVKSQPTPYSGWRRQTLRDKTVDWFGRRLKAYDTLSLILASQPTYGPELLTLPTVGMCALPLALYTREPDFPVEGLEFSQRDNLLQRLVDNAERELTVGYVHSAAAMLGAYSRFGEQSGKFNVLVEAVKARLPGIEWLVPIYQPGGEWKQVLEELAKSVESVSKRSGPKTTISNGHIVWGLTIDRHYEYVGEATKPDPYVRCRAVTPFFRPPRAPEDASGDRKLTLKALVNGKYDAILSDTDRQVVSFLVSRNYDPRRAGYVPDEVMSALVNHPSLVLGEAAKESAKMEALAELLSSLRENRHRALIFSQFTDYLAIVRRELETLGFTYLYLDGSTPAAERDRLVNDFQSGGGDFFLISLKAGGTGLNLTAANYVILLDPWWNPAVENQAADRAHRIGQKNPVTVYRLIASDTVEERVLELHQEKKAIAEDVLDGTGSSALTPAQLMKLFS